MCYCPTPTLHLNLALTGDGAFLLSLKKTHSVWFISVLNYGDTENVLINHILLVIRYTHVIIQICVLINHINMPILVCMVHCGNVLSMIIMWSLRSALTSEGADWDTLLLTDSRVNIFMHKSWFINNSLTLTTNSKSMEKYSMFEQIVINIYMKFLKWH